MYHLLMNSNGTYAVVGALLAALGILSIIFNDKLVKLFRTIYEPLLGRLVNTIYPSWLGYGIGPIAFVAGIFLVVRFFVTDN